MKASKEFDSLLIHTQRSHLNSWADHFKMRFNQSTVQIDVILVSETEIATGVDFLGGNARLMNQTG